MSQNTYGNTNKESSLNSANLSHKTGDRNFDKYPFVIQKLLLLDLKIDAFSVMVTFNISSLSMSIYRDLLVHMETPARLDLLE